MIQTKYFYSYGSGLHIDKDINTWIEQNKNLIIIDIKLSATDRNTSVLVLYKEGGKK